MRGEKTVIPVVRGESVGTESSAAGELCAAPQPCSIAIRKLVRISIDKVPEQRVRKDRWAFA